MIYGGHLPSLGFAGAVLSIAIIVNVNKDWSLLIIAYLISQVIYNYNHLSEVSEDVRTNPERAKHLQKNKKYSTLLFTIYIFFLILLLITVSNFKFLILVVFLLAVGILYTKFFKSFTKKIIGFKNLYVALTWALGGIFLPLLYYSLSFSLTLFLLFLFIFLRCIVNTVFFDLKDIESDRQSKLLTLPVTLGVHKTLKYLYLVNILSFLPLFIGLLLKIMPFFTFGLIIFYFYSLYYLRKAGDINLKNLRSLSYVIVDGEYIWWPAILFFIKFFSR